MALQKIRVSFALVLAALPALGQSNPNNSAANAYSGSVQAVANSPGVRQLSLDDAVRLGIENNLALTEARANERLARAQSLRTLNLLLPTVNVAASHGVHQYNLAAQGFRPDVLRQFASAFPGLPAGGFPLIVKVNLTDAQATLNQQLFNWAGYDLYRATRANAKAAHYGAESSRGLVVLNVGNAYLQALADQA